MLDEPFVGLDPEASFHVKEMLRELAGRGSAVFFSSHVLEVVEKLCNKVAIIKQGELRACGPTSEVVGDENLEDVFLDMIERDVQGARGADGMRGIDDAHRAQGSQGAHGAGEPREGREVDAACASRSAQTGRTGCGRRS